jgi:hypothetical protein
MELEHTPGPWEIGTPPPNGEQTIGTDKGLMVATATTGYINTKANARLIAAAPEMINALIELVSIVKIHSKATGSDFAWAEMEYARKAIEHATGKPIDEVIK